MHTNYDSKKSKHLPLVFSGYVGKLKEIHPTFSLRPNHHVSFHLYDFLLLFGPAHSWWCFPFEHLIGILQRLPINHKFGELENTRLHSYIKAARLHHWLARTDCLPAIQECRALFDKVYAPKGAPDPSQELAADPTDDIVQVPDLAMTSTVPEDLYALIRASMHMGNSQIFFYPNGDQSLTSIAASIKYIYDNNCTIDAFSMYPDFPAKLYLTNVQSRLEKVKVSWVVSHFARWAV
ncbi:hypothetical protein P692DRAFT_20880781 [Suillus brevipes Sb2]|nr:hypothetical protein P692DRAFT_20880781 [Suillus brevipes Sb2]